MVYEETFDMEERDKVFVATDGGGFLCIENKMTVRVGRVLMDRIESVICNSLIRWCDNDTRMREQRSPRKPFLLSKRSREAVVGTNDDPGNP